MVGIGEGDHVSFVHVTAGPDVADGYIVLTYDPVGQGRSEGNIVDLFGVTLPKATPCIGLAACIDAQDMARWFTGRSIVRVADNGPRAEPRKNPATSSRTYPE